MKRNLGDKGVFISDSHIRQIAELYTNLEETEHSKIYPNDFFGYTKVQVERPLIDGETGDILRDKRGNLKPDPVRCETMSASPSQRRLMITTSGRSNRICPTVG